MARDRTHAHSRMIEAHEKSVVLGGALTLFPVQPGLTHAFARNIRAAMERAEDSAYRKGQEDAQREMRAALGLSK